MSRADLRRRVDALNRTINPADSMSAKLVKLTTNERAVYDRWRDQCAAFYADHPRGEAYAMLIDGDGPQTLRRAVHDALFGATFGIPADSTIAQASEIYRRAALGD